MNGGPPQMIGGGPPEQSGPPLSNQGIVKRWFGEKGFGFIVPSGSGADVFVHRRALVGTYDLAEGALVTFEAEFEERTQKYKARTCTLVDPAGAIAPPPGGPGGGRGDGRGKGKKGGGGRGFSNNPNAAAMGMQKGGGGGGMGGFPDNGPRMGGQTHDMARMRAQMGGMMPMGALGDAMTAGPQVGGAGGKGGGGRGFGDGGRGFGGPDDMGMGMMGMGMPTGPVSGGRGGMPSGPVTGGRGRGKGGKGDKGGKGGKGRGDKGGGGGGGGKNFQSQDGGGMGRGMGGGGVGGPSMQMMQQSRPPGGMGGMDMGAHDPHQQLNEPQMQVVAQLPLGWVQLRSPDGIFFVNSNTRQVSQDLPAELRELASAQQMGLPQQPQMGQQQHQQMQQQMPMQQQQMQMQAQMQAQMLPQQQLQQPVTEIKAQIGDWLICEDDQGVFYRDQITGETYDQPPAELLRLYQEQQQSQQQGQQPHQQQQRPQHQQHQQQQHQQHQQPPQQRMDPQMYQEVQQPQMPYPGQGYPDPYGDMSPYEHRSI